VIVDDKSEPVGSRVGALLKATEIHVAARREVDTDDGAVLHPRQRAPLRVETAIETLNASVVVC
jgi:hypothetical protein